MPVLWSFGELFLNDTAPTEIYTLSLHDALPICHTGSATRLARPPKEPRRHDFVRPLDCVGHRAHGWHVQRGRRHVIAIDALPQALRASDGEFARCRRPAVSLR